MLPEARKWYRNNWHRGKSTQVTVPQNLYKYHEGAYEVLHPQNTVYLPVSASNRGAGS